MTQTQIEQLSMEEYSHFLAYGEPKRTQFLKKTEEIVNIWAHDLYTNEVTTENDCLTTWISTLDSTTYPDTTFGYLIAP